MSFAVIGRFIIYDIYMKPTLTHAQLLAQNLAPAVAAAATFVHPPQRPRPQPRGSDDSYNYSYNHNRSVSKPIHTKTSTSSRLTSFHSTQKSPHKYHNTLNTCHTMVNNDNITALADRFEDSLSTRGGSRNRGSRFRRGGGGGSGSNSASRSVDLSRALSRLLRHQAENAGIPLDKEGFAPLDRVLAWGPLASMRPSLGEIRELVRESDKQRFKLKRANGREEEDGEGGDDGEEGDWLIRANQGHSIKLESEGGLLKRLVLPGEEGGEEGVPVPETVVHGTYFAFWAKIVESGGLKPMGRNHVHCSTGLPDDEAGVISGMRKDAQLLIYIDVEASIRDGMKWWMSENRVVLTEGGEDGVVPLKFFKEVRGRVQGVGVLWQDGQWVADLPAGIKLSAPHGKGGRGGRGVRGGRGRK